MRVRPVRGRAGAPVVYALGGYREPLSELIIAQKERGRLDLARPLGLALAEVVAAALGDGAMGGVPPSGVVGAAGSVGAGRSAEGIRPVDSGALVGSSGPDGHGAAVWAEVAAGRVAGSVGPDGRGVANPAGPGRTVFADASDLVAGPGSRAGSVVSGGWAGWSIFLVPIPSAKSAERRRGQDPVLRMARVAAARLRRTGLRPDVLRALRHRRAVTDQVGLSRAERARNLAGAMTVTPAGRRALTGGPCVVVLLDDVCTSGATLGEGARAVAAIPGFGSAGGRVLAAVLAGPVR